MARPADIPLGHLLLRFVRERGSAAVTLAPISPCCDISCDDATGYFRCFCPETQQEGRRVLCNLYAERSPYPSKDGSRTTRESRGRNGLQLFRFAYEHRHGLAEPGSYAFERGQLHVLPAPFDEPVLCAVHVDVIGKPLLSPFAFAPLTNYVGYTVLQARAGGSSHCAILR